MSPNVFRTHLLRLLDKLAHDDLFRGRFERNPKNALIEAGFDDVDAANFPADQLLPGTLASKALFAAEHERMRNAVVEAYACMVLPGPMLLGRHAVPAESLVRAA